MKNGGRPEPAPAPQTLARSLWKSVPVTEGQDGLPRCGLCDRHREPAWPGHPWCGRCVDDLGEALDRRRAAELRLVPLDRVGAS